jgi:hypothetical protein
MVPGAVPVVTPVPLQPPMVMVTVPALLVMLVMVTVTLHLQLPSHIGRCTLDLGASVPATRRTAPPVQSRCRPTHQERLFLTSGRWPTGSMQPPGHQPLVQGTRQQELPSDGSGPATMPTVDPA